MDPTRFVFNLNLNFKKSKFNRERERERPKYSQVKVSFAQVSHEYHMFYSLHNVFGFITTFVPEHRCLGTLKASRECSRMP